MASTDEGMLDFQSDLRRIGEGYLMFVICVVGVFGNLLAFVTFSAKSVRKSTTSIYLRALAIADILVLLTAVFRYKTYKLFLNDEDEIDSVFYFDAYVEVYIEPLHWTALGSSSFITIALSLERYLAVKYPLLIKRSCSVTIVLLCILTVVAVAAVITLPNFTSYTITKFHFLGIDVAVATLTKMGETTLYPCTYHNYIVPILWYIIPAILLSVLNILLSVHVQKSTRIRVGLPHVSNPNRKLTLLIIFIVSAYILCNFPKCVFMFYKLIHEMSDQNECIQNTNKINSPDTKAYLVIEVITELLNVLNSCMNFLVYCLVGTRFRKELKRTITCKWGKKTESWTFPTNQQSSVINRDSGISA